MRPDRLFSLIGLPRPLRVSLLVWIAAAGCHAQTPAQTENQKAFRGCLPVSERTSEIGCWILATEPAGKLSASPTFWYLDGFSTLALAGKAKKQSGRGTLVQALGRVWLMTIANDGWLPSEGERISKVGPLPLEVGPVYVAQYMEAIMTPGMETAIHRHPGPEAWYTESGETCLETPEGKQVGRKGTMLLFPLVFL